MSTVATVARMRATMFRRALRDSPGPAVGALIGLLAAGWLIVYAVRAAAQPGTLAVFTGSWVLGWILLPLLLGGVRGRIRPGHLRLEPVRPPAAAVALLTSAAIGIGPVVSLVALAALPAHAARHGVAAALLTAVGALLLWLAGLIGSSVALEAAGRTGGPVGSVLTGVLTGSAMGVLGSAWAVAPWASLLLVTGPPARLDRVLRAAYGSPVTLLILLLTVAAGFAGYLHLVRRALAGTTRPAAGRAGTRPGRFPRGPVAGVAGREWRSWRRHPLRLQYLAFALVYAVLLAGLPLLAGVTLLAPWAGVLFALWAATMAAGLVGLDGTSLWLPMTAPGGERAEVLGRSLAWLALVAPAGVLLTVLGQLVAPGVAPLAALAVLPAALGAGGAVAVWVSLLRVRPVDDPRRPAAADNPTDIVSVLLVMAGVVVTAAPGFALVVWGPPGLGVPAGVLCGAAAWWGATWAAVQRLSRRGTEVLGAAGQRTREPAARIPLTWDAAWARDHRTTVWSVVLLTVGWIPVVPQCLMVLVFDVNGGWLVASQLTGTARTATALGMMTLGGAMLLTGLILWDRREPDRQGAPPASPTV